MPKALRVILVIVLILTFGLCTFAGGMAAGWYLPRNIASRLPIPLPFDTTSEEGGTPSTLETTFIPFWKAWDIVHAYYVDQPLDDTKLMEGAINGMMESLGDPHSSYMDPDQFKQMNADLGGEYEGIGAWVDVTGDYLTIISPMTGSPAEKAGVKPGDQIIAVNGEDMTGIDGNLVLKRVLGPAGTDVTLTILRSGVSEPFDVTITRATITVPSVEGKMLDDGIAYVQLTTFGLDTAKDLHNILEDLLAQNPKGLILDLRYNGGGYLDTAVSVVSEFLDDGVALYEVYGDGTRDTYTIRRGGIATEIPLVVLVNEGTASASEITAGAIQDYDRGTLVGVTTFGKGSVQTMTPLGEGEGAVRVTIARWITPKERQINGIGLTPDEVVEITDEDVTAERDPQLERAIEILLK